MSPLKLVDGVSFRSDDTVLVHAAAVGVGPLLSEYATYLGRG